MRTAFDRLIEETTIEESYGRKFNQETWKSVENTFDSLIKEFNLKKM